MHTPKPLVSESRYSRLKLLLEGWKDINHELLIKSSRRDSSKR